MTRRYPIQTLREVANRFETMGRAKVYGFPYIDYFQVCRGKIWHTVRQILTAADGTQCERLVQANKGGYRILRVTVLCTRGVNFGFRYKIVCD